VSGLPVVELEPPLPPQYWLACHEQVQDRIVDLFGRDAEARFERISKRIAAPVPYSPLLLAVAGLRRGYSETRPARLWVGSLNAVSLELAQSQCELDVIGQITRIRRRSLGHSGGLETHATPIRTNGDTVLSVKAHSEYLQTALRQSGLDGLP